MLHPLTKGRLVALVCAAQVLVQIGAFFWPALLPDMSRRWKLSNSDAGWITSVFYGAYMLAVPVLVTATDRIDAKRIYLLGVGCTAAGHLLFGLYAEGFWSAMATRALTGIGWAGTYMTAVKLLSDHVDARLLSRAVAGHAASIGISGALSFACAELLARMAGWQFAFFAGGVSAAIAWVLVAGLVPPARVPAAGASTGRSLFDFRPVFRNRSVMAYSLGYCVHTLEMSALRGWAVTFLAFVAGATGNRDALLSPVLVVTALGLLGTVASVLGNEAAMRIGRRRLIVIAMGSAMLVGGSLGYVGSTSYGIAVALLMVYAVVVWLDSASLTAGAAGSADPSLRGATLAVHSMLGYAGGFVGPLMVGFILDRFGDPSRAAWGAAFLAVAVLVSLALLAFTLIRPNELAGDRATP